MQLPLTRFLDKTGHYCRICHEQIGELEFDAFGGYDADDAPVVTHEGAAIDDFLEDEAIERSRTGSAVSRDTALDCNQYDTNDQKQYACIVLRYLSEQGQLRLNSGQMTDAINTFYAIIKTNELTAQTKATFDLNNRFLTENVNNQYLRRFGNPPPNTDRWKQVVGLSRATSRASYQFDRYLLVLISAVVTLELSQPETQLTPNAPLINRILQQQVDDRRMVTNLRGIQIGHTPLIPKPEIDKSLNDFVNGKAVTPFFGSDKGMTILEYIQTKGQQYYQMVINYPDFKVQYSAATQRVNDSIARQTNTPVVDPESQLVEVPSLQDDDYRYTTLPQYDHLMTRLDQRLKYLGQLRVIRVHKLTNRVFNLVRGQAELIQGLARYPTNQECPTDLRQLYVDYILGVSQGQAPVELIRAQRAPLSPQDPLAKVAAQLSTPVLITRLALSIIVPRVTDLSRIGSTAPN